MVLSQRKGFIRRYFDIVSVFDKMLKNNKIEFYTIHFLIERNVILIKILEKLLSYNLKSLEDSTEKLFCFDR